MPTPIPAITIVSTTCLLTALALAGCSPPTAPDPRPSPDRATPSPAATATPATATIRDDHAQPVPGELKTFGDWTVACDNLLRCTTASLGADGEGFPEVTMQIARAAGPAGGYTITLHPLTDESATPATITIGARRVDVTGAALRGAAAQAIVAAAANAPALVIADAKGAPITTVSLKGVAAALRYIDARQHRAGTVTATVATGARPAADVPAAPAAPRIAALALNDDGRVPDADQVARMRRIGACEETIGAPRAHALADGATLILLPCSAGAYNEIDALFVIRDGRVAPADVDAPSGFEATGADPATPVRSVINGSVAGGVLTSDAKGRGLGDCGVRQRFVWDGRTLRLADQSAMGECRGNPHYLPIWHAEVQR